MRFEVIEKRLEEMDAKLTEISHHLDDPVVRSSLDLLVKKRATGERYHSNNSGGSSIIRISFVSICVQKAANAVVCDRISLNSLTKIVDAIITGLGLFGSMAVIAKLEAFLGVQLFVLPMMSSCIIFFSPLRPANPYSFIANTGGAAVFAAGAFLVLMSEHLMTPTLCAGVIAGVTLVWTRITGTQITCFTCKKDKY